MHIEEFRDYCLAKPGVTEHFPFDEVTLVFKVMGKMYALCGIEPFDSFNLKCDPERALELRGMYDGIRPGYHMSKKHWNTIHLDHFVPEKLMYELIDHSYDLVVKSLTKKDREALKNLRVTG